MLELQSINGSSTSLPPYFDDLLASVPMDNEAGVDAEDDHGGKKLKWLRSQIIGQDAEFATPFGKRRMTYCDHTASGRLMKVVEDYLQDHVYPFYGNTHTEDSYVGLHTTQLMQEAHLYVKQCMGGGPGDILLFCGTGSTAAIKRLQELMGVAVPPVLRPTLLCHLPPSDRWVVFLGPYEHHSNLLSWRWSLADVVEIGLDQSGGIDIDILEAALRSPQYAGRRKVGAFSASSNVTGVITDTRTIARVLHQNGAYACFDFACSGPYVEMDMRSGEVDGYDAVFVSPHKFLGGPGSPGILLMTEALYLLKDGPPSTCGGGIVHFVAHDEEDTLYYTDPEEREDAGTPAITQKVRAALAFRVKEYIGTALIWRKEEELARLVMSRLGANPSIFILGSNVEARQPIVSFLVYPKVGGGAASGKSLHCRFVTILLNDLFGIQARGGCACAGPYVHHLLQIGLAKSTAVRAAVQRGFHGVKPGFTRLNFCYYAPPEETEFVLSAIEFIARYGHRFLVLYNFNWKTGDWRCHGSQVEQLRSRAPSTHRTAIVAGEGMGELQGFYAEYMNTATCMAKALPDVVAERETPEGVDPTLATFL